MSEEQFFVFDFNNICRFCLEPGVLSNIFEDSIGNYLVDQLNEFINIDVLPNDGFPTKVCHRCRYKIELCFEFKHMLDTSRKTLMTALSVDIKDVENSRQDFGTACTEDVKTANEKSVDVFFNLDVAPETKRVKQRKMKRLAFKSKKGRNVKERPFNHYPTMANAYKRNQCLLCLEICEGKEALQSHVDDHIRGTLLEPYYRLKERNNLCKVCDVTFDYRFNLLTHQREHLNLKPFKCLHQGCGSAYFSNTTLKHHLSMHAERNFICKSCGMAFKRMSDLKGHEIIHEDADKQYTCPVCGLACKNRLTLGAHSKKHKVQPRFTCAHCQKRYFSNSELARHMKTHSEVKEFRCDTCSRAYYSKSALVRHQKSHVDQYVCAVCGSNWNSLTEYECHLKCHTHLSGD